MRSATVGLAASRASPRSPPPGPAAFHVLVINLNTHCFYSLFQFQPITIRRLRIQISPASSLQAAYDKLTAQTDRTLNSVWRCIERIKEEPSVSDSET